MKINIRFCGRYKELVGNEEYTLDINSGASIWLVIDRVVKVFPKLEKDKQFMMVLKNNVFTNRDEQIIDGDEITLLPPVVGGG